MKSVNKYFSCFFVGIVITVAVNAQSGQRFGSSFRLQYGLYQYNNNQNGLIDSKNNHFLSLGLTYRQQLGRVSGLNITGRYYQWILKPNNDLKTYAAQAMWVLHAKRISSNWQLNRIVPYAGIGIGYEKHYLNNVSAVDTAFTNYYFPLEAGIIYNFSTRWSVAVFGEYKLAPKTDLEKFIYGSSGNQEIVNTAGVSLAWHFGKIKKKINAPIIYSNPNLKPIPVEKEKRLTPVKKQVKKANPVTQKTDTVVLQKIQSDSVKKMFPESKYNTDAVSIGILKVPATDSVDSVRKNKTTDSLKKKIKTVKNQLVDTAKIVSLLKKDSLSELRNTDSTNIPLKQDLKKELTIDSLIGVIQLLNNSVNELQESALNDDEDVKDTPIIKPFEIDLKDEPVIVRLKESYNKLGEYTNKNYEQGHINEAKLNAVKNESAHIKNSIQKLSNEDEVVFNELSVLYDAIIALQMEQNKIGADSAILEEDNYIENYDQTEMNSLQYKMDKLLLELEYMKQYGNIKHTDTANQPLEKLKNNQAIMQEKLTRMEAQNSLLQNLFVQLTREKIADEITTSRTGQVKDSLINYATSLNKDENIIATINFALNSSTVTNLFKTVLKKIVDSVINRKEGIVILSGFTDKSGNAAYNLKLSQKRVQAVKSEMIKNGIRKDFILERYFGSEKSGGNLNVHDRKVVVRILTY